MASMRHAVAADLDPLIEILVRAFEDDPFFRWMLPGGHYSTALSEWFHLVVPIAFTKGHTFLDTGRRSAAVWLPPDVELATAEDYRAAAAIVASHSSPEHAADVFAAIASAGAHRPSTPNWQLMYVGVMPEAQGRGEGRVALTSVLRTCDEQAFPAYLHSTNPRNLSFYERLGFRVIAEVPAVQGGPVIRPMWREPQ